MTKGKPGVATDSTTELTQLGRSILVQLRIANRFSAAALKVKMEQKDIVKLLASTGASSQEIADVLDTTSATINNALLRLRKKATNVSSTADSEPSGADEAATAT